MRLPFPVFVQAVQNTLDKEPGKTLATAYRSLVDLAFHRDKPRVENGIATRCITREKRQGRDLTRVRTYETDACAHSFRSRRFVDRLRILRPDKNGSDRGTRRDRNIWRDSARKNCRISGATTILSGAAIASSLLLTVIRKCFLRSFVLTDECIFSFFSWKRIFLISKDITNFVFS